MTSEAVFRKSYTNAPDLRSNFFSGSIQLLAWLFFHPKAWHHQIQCIDLNLPPHFCLAELNTGHFTNPVLRRLLMRGFLFLPLVTFIFSIVILWLFDAVGNAFPLGIVFGLGFGLAIGIMVSVASGIVATVLSTCAFTLLFGTSDILLIDPLIKMPYALIFGGILGISVHVLNNVASQPEAGSQIKRYRNSAAGIAIGVGLLFVSIGTAFAIVFYWQRGVLNNIFTATIMGVVFGIFLGGAVGLRTRIWRRGLIAGIIICIVVGLLFYAVFDSQGQGDHPSGISLLATTTLVISLVILILFIVPFVIVERIVGAKAGAFAGLFAFPSVFIGVWFVFEIFKWPINVAVSLLVCFFSITLAWWFPILLYPLSTAWHKMLFQFDQDWDAQDSFLRWHTAFWDEQQWLPWRGLDDHLVWLVENRPDEGRQAMNYLAESRQRWAAQAAQIELDARDLEKCKDVESIALAHQSFADEGFEGPANALLRSLNRISQDVEAALRQSSMFNQRLALSAVADRLDRLLRELTRSNEPYTKRFRPVALSWQQIITRYIARLVGDIELRQEIDNPYVTGIPLTAQQDIFVGRTDISRRIENLLLDRRRPPLLLYGQRRMGKTSLLNNLGRLLPHTIIPLFVDLQGPVSYANDHAGFFYNIARSMRNSIKQQRDIDIPLLQMETLTRDPFTVFDVWLDALEESLHTTEGNIILFALDEFEALDKALRDERLNEARVLGTLRHIIQHRTRIKVLLAGSHTLQEFQRWSSYFINAQVVQISYLTEVESRQLIEEPIQDFALRYQPDAIQLILELTRGHPFLIQLLCGEIVVLKNEQLTEFRRLATVTDVAAAIPKALDVGTLFFTDIAQNQIDRKAKALLNFISRHNQGVMLNKEDLLVANLNAEELDLALVSLIQRELIEETSEGFRFQVELIRRWFAKGML